MGDTRSCWMSSWISPFHLCFVINCIYCDFLLLIYTVHTIHLFHVYPSWERDPSIVALLEVASIFSLLKFFFFSCEFSLNRFEGLRTEGVYAVQTVKPLEANCDL